MIYPKAFRISTSSAEFTFSKSPKLFSRSSSSFSSGQPKITIRAFNPKAIVYHYHPETLFKYLKVKFERAFYRVNLYSKHTDKIVKDSYTTPWIKFQIAAGYAGFVLFLVSIPLISVGQFALGAGALGLSTIIGTLGLLSTLQFTKYALKKDFGVAAASLIIIPLRTIAFQLGLVLGTIKYKVLK